MMGKVRKKEEIEKLLQRMAPSESW